MRADSVLKQLEGLGSAQTRKTYGRHGVTGAMYGVKYGDLGKLVKQHRGDGDLAQELWDSENHDARILATMIVDRERVTARTLGAWVRSIDNHVISSALATLVAEAPAGRKLMPKWMAGRGEWKPGTGWMALAYAVRGDDAPNKSECSAYLKQIAESIHTRPNRVKYSMNTALISIGTFVEGLEDAAIRAARKIGKVEVDHGLTHCQTPSAEPEIRKRAAKQREKIAKQRSGPRR